MPPAPSRLSMRKSPIWTPVSRLELIVRYPRDRRLFHLFLDDIRYGLLLESGSGQPHTRVGDSVTRSCESPANGLRRVRRFASHFAAAVKGRHLPSADVRRVTSDEVLGGWK